MSDQDFNFAPPPQKRDKPKPFEPPPWEKEQFDELERRKAAEKAAEGSTEQATGAAAVGEEPSTAGPAPEKQEERPLAREPETRGDTAQAETASAGPKGEPVSQPSIEAMLVQLKGEEPPVGKGIWKVSLAVSFVVVVIGLAVSTVGLVALSRRLGQAGTLGGFVLLTFGISFIAIGIWVTFQTLRQQGVL